MIFHKFFDPVDFNTRKTTATLQSDRIKPEFRGILVSFDVYMGRFIAITRIKEETEWTNMKNGGH